MTVKQIAQNALIAAVYTAASLLLAPISFGAIQARVGEALTVLPILFPQYLLGLGLGCFLTNLFGVFMGINVAGALDIVIGTLATVIAGLLSIYFRKSTIKGFPLLSFLAPVLVNAIIIGAELYVVLFPDAGTPVLVGTMLEVGIGEALSVFVLGTALWWQFGRTLKKTGAVESAN
ncbi:MAG: QueT transporter family protein [Erysipelotrichaceae bacterium]|jgi:uncharacterized membrane protein|nr:QueT transporter family protein [Erysipelotrichaceae bacterium]